MLLGFPPGGAWQGNASQSPAFIRLIKCGTVDASPHCLMSRKAGNLMPRDLLPILVGLVVVLLIGAAIIAML